MMMTRNRALAQQRIDDNLIREKLQSMEIDPTLMVTATSFSTDSALYPDGQIPFVEKHIAYLLDHPNVNPDQYLSNLRLMLKKRG